MSQIVLRFVLTKDLNFAGESPLDGQGKDCSICEGTRIPSDLYKPGLCVMFEKESDGK
jgi:hypothetical protein